MCACVFLLSLPHLISPPHPCGCYHVAENFMMSENFVFTREMENVFQREHIQIQPTNRQLMNFTSQKYTKTLTNSLVHTRTWRERDTPNCGMRIILSLCYCYTVFFPPHLISRTIGNFFGIFFRSFFPSGFSFLRFQYKLFLFFLFHERAELHVVYLFFNMGQRINCC